MRKRETTHHKHGCGGGRGWVPWRCPTQTHSHDPLGNDGASKNNHENHQRKKKVEKKKEEEGDTISNVTARADRSKAWQNRYGLDFIRGKILRRKDAKHHNR